MIAVLRGLRAPHVEHRLDRDHHAGLQARPCSSFAVVRHLWIFMHLPAAAVADVLTDHTIAVTLTDALNGMTDVTNAVPDPRRLDTLPQCLTAGVYQFGGAV